MREARSLRQGVSHSLDHLDERLRVKVYLWMHGQSAKLQECHSDCPATCHRLVFRPCKVERGTSEHSSDASVSVKWLLAEVAPH